MQNQWWSPSARRTEQGLNATRLQEFDSLKLKTAQLVNSPESWSLSVSRSPDGKLLAREELQDTEWLTVVGLTGARLSSRGRNIQPEKLCELMNLRSLSAALSAAK
ncbi:hypothetical protein EYF80_002807 [Liparis tanakae]|uniref:Uncharacterized protein n=1 Tax=Liparis tanakae TaxID=230148 RepID=A0A4Z2JCM2_9TELE|nr:hypothetical protein EYF80_002807 [Liparis tanakae]